MVPDVILDIIHEYTKELDAFTDLPPFRSVRRLMDACDRFVIEQLGVTMGMPSNEVQRMRFRLEMRGEFVFYFHMSISQRIQLLETLQRAMKKNRHISCMVWIFLEKEPRLVELTGYQTIFGEGLFCRLMQYLLTHSHSIP